MKKIEILTMPSVRCPIAKDDRNPSDCEGCDAYKGVIDSPPEPLAILCGADELQNAKYKENHVAGGA